MVKKPHQIEKIENKLEGRLEFYLGDSTTIGTNLENGRHVLTDTMRYVDDLNAFNLKLTDDLLPGLRKETNEAVVAGNIVFDLMDQSSDSLIKVLDLLKYHYGSGNPIIEDYISPPTKGGFGRRPEKRILVHKRNNEAFGRHPDDFSGPMVEDFETAKNSGEALEEAWNIFLKEENEASLIIKDCIDTLAEYRKLRRRIRNKLKSEFDDPQEAYKYVPKQKRRKKSKKNQAPVE